MTPLTWGAVGFCALISGGLIGWWIRCLMVERADRRYEREARARYLAHHRSLRTNEGMNDA